MIDPQYVRRVCIRLCVNLGLDPHDLTDKDINGKFLGHRKVPMWQTYAPAVGFQLEVRRAMREVDKESKSEQQGQNLQSAGPPVDERPGA